MSSRPFLTQVATEVAEGVTARITGVIVDAAGDGIPAGALDTLRLTLFDKQTGTILNSRDDVSVLNANGGSVSGAGLFALTLSPEDNALHNQAVPAEIHVVYLEWTYNGGADRGRALVEFPVRNLVKAT